jgi:hypothetical protein
LASNTWRAAIAPAIRSEVPLAGQTAFAADALENAVADLAGLAVDQQGTAAAHFEIRLLEFWRAPRVGAGRQGIGFRLFRRAHRR